jgi:hypothetical protein
MSLQHYYWTQKDLNKTEYVGKYATHDNVNKDTVIEQLDSDSNDLEFGEHTLEYNNRQMDVRLDVNNEWASFMYDETFEDELGDQYFNEVIVYFLTPDRWKSYSNIHPE